MVGVLVLGFPRWVGSDLVMPRYFLRMSVLPVCWLLRACYWVGGSLQGCFVNFYFRTVAFYLGGGATWGIISTECGLPRLI